VRCLATIGFALVATAGVARADKGDEQPNESEQLVLVNATPKLGDLGQIDRMRRVLDSRGLVHKLPDSLEAELDGRSVLVADVDAIKDTYMNQEYGNALKMIEDDEARILKGTGAGDPVPALAELSQWRGMIAVATHKDDEAIGWFRAAYRFNPAWTVEKKFASPNMNRLVKKARREAHEMGKLRVDADPETAQYQVDGGDKHPVSEKTELQVGHHLVTVFADGRTTYAEMVDITENKTYKLPISLTNESNNDRAAKLIDATLAAPAGKARLKRLKALSHVTDDVKRMLVIEDAADDHVTMRVYDIQTKKVSKSFDIEGTASSAEISRLVTAALDPDTMLDANHITVIQAMPQPMRWYEHWYVWVGVAAIVGASFGGYEYMTREPTSVRF
jgi:hypothetical protein